MTQAGHAVSSAERRTERLSVWSLVLGFLSCITCFIPGIPAVICGHISLRRIGKDAALKGKGLAIAGLALGYLSFVVTLALAILCVQVWQEVATKVRILQDHNVAQAICARLCVEESYAGHKSPWPAENGIATVADLRKFLISRGIIQKDELFPFESYLIGNISEDDPPETVFIKSKPSKKGCTFVVFKNGVGHLHADGKSPDEGQDPPRTPAYLESGE